MGGLEGTVRGRTATACVRVVDQIIVDERRGLEDLQRGADVPQRVGLCRVTVSESRDGTPTRMAEARTQAFAAVEGAGGRVEERRRVRTVVRRFVPHPREEAVEVCGDGVGDGGGGRHDSQHT